MFFDDDEKDLDDKYLVEEEKLKTVFNDDEKAEVILVDDEPEDIPQNSETYQVKSQLILEEDAHLAPISVTKEMRSSFLEYAMSVIVSRALPDARDGLKPVHRRILYGMHELGVTSSVPHKKSARIVGDVLGKYHPHGDSSVYEAMVRMSQDFSMRYPMVDGHGNFGSIDGDGAAAMRYTEARMSKIAGLMVQGIKKNTVDFVPNYDGSEVEPAVLPSAIPNLLITGATGIAVGMATSIPPHNLGEVIDGVVALARNKDITISELMGLIHAPDFPTGGLLLGVTGIKSAYETGKGAVLIRSKTHIELMKNGKARIVVTEIPYMVNKARMIEKIAQLVKDKVIEGISDLRDETSRKGIRVVIDIKKGFVPEVVLNKIFKLTQLQTNFPINILALVDGQPKILDLKSALNVYLQHQYQVITRRTTFDLEKAEARAHILEGLKIAISNIDAVIRIIRGSQNDAAAQNELSKTFDLTEIQAKAIIEMRLGRLTGLAIEKMNEEIQILADEISGLRNILNNHDVLTEVIISELNEVKERFADDRRSEILYGAGLIEDEDLIPVKDIAIVLSAKGYVKRIPLDEYTVQNRGGVGVKTMNTYEDDFVSQILTTTTHTDLLIFTSLARVFRIRAHQVPEMSKQAKGIPFLNLINIQKDEKIISLLTTNDYGDEKKLVTVTLRGLIKKTNLEEYSRINRNGKRALSLREGDELLKALIVTDNEQMIIGSSYGKVVRFAAGDFRSSGRTATGVKAINLTDHEDNVVAGVSSTSNGEYIFSLGEDGFGKKTLVTEYRQTSRGGKGVTSLNVSKAGKLIHVEVVKGHEDMLVATRKGATIRTSLNQISTTSRATKGVKIIKINDGNIINSVSIIDSEAIEQKAEEVLRKTQEIQLPKPAE